MKRVIFFDLDGTLTKSDPGIVNAVAYSLEKMGIHDPDREHFRRFIGPPIFNSFQNFYGMDKKTAEKALSYYREYYVRKGQYENSVYPGIPELLTKLREQGKVPVVATSKPDVYTNEILRFLHLAPYFDYVAAATLDGSRKEKIDVIRYGLSICGEKDLSKIVMVGDRKFDILGARMAGLSSIGVLYGYGSREELENAGADRIAATVEELGALLTREE